MRFGYGGEGFVCFTIVPANHIALCTSTSARGTAEGVFPVVVTVHDEWGTPIDTKNFNCRVVVDGGMLWKRLHELGHDYTRVTFSHYDQR